MRAWILFALVAGAALGGLPTAAFAAPTPSPTSTSAPKTVASPTPTATATHVAPTATPTRVPPTATAVPAPPTPTAAPPTPVATVTPVAAAPAATASPATPAPTSSTSSVTPGGNGAIHGEAFIDADADGQVGDSEVGLARVEVKLNFANGLSRSATTDDTGAFAFEGLAPGTYRVTVTVPNEYVTTTDPGEDVDVVAGSDTPDVLFGLISMQAAGLNPDGSAIADPNAVDPNADDEQIIALASVTSLPLRFAEGRDLMAQVQRRVLGDGLVWLGVPFRSQIDGGDFQYVNCGPASLTMVLAGFGLEVGPSQVRDYLNNLIDNFNTDLGTSLDVLSRIGKEAGLTPMDLYSDAGGYRNWSTDAVRWHVQQGHPVITLVKYRNLPGHTGSLSEFDHYIVISGLTPNGFIYNDAAFATTLGYGLEISDVELEYAWDNSSIPHHALAMGLSPDKKALSFPELPRTPRPAADLAPARGMRRLAEADEVVRAPLTLTPVLPVVIPAGPLTVGADQWQTDPTFDLQPLDDSGVPMGLNLETSDQSTLEPRPGPGTMVPKMLTVLGVGWLLWMVWSTSGRMVRFGSQKSEVRSQRWHPWKVPFRTDVT